MKNLIVQESETENTLHASKIDEPKDGSHVL
jgi:hypothetical protein